MLIHKLRKRVEALNLNLKGRVVLTEAATGPYVVTPVLAALAGAKVFAYSKDSRYGTIEEVVENTKGIYKDVNDAFLDISFVDKLSPDVISQADIITNSGHLRPLHKEMLQYAKDSAVIPLMYEAWEWRDADLEISYIKERGLKVGATNERHPEVDVFNYLGDMAVKQVLDAGLCLYKNKFLLIVNNDFGPYIAKAVSKMCEALGVIDLKENRSKYQFDNVEWIDDFPGTNIPEHFAEAEAIIFTAYPFNKTWFGDDNQSISLSNVKERLLHPLVLRYAGDIDVEAFEKSGIRYFPEHVQSGHMGILPSAIGFDPIIRLQAGGLKVGEALITGEYQYKGLPILELV